MENDQNTNKWYLFILQVFETDFYSVICLVARSKPKNKNIFKTRRKWGH